MIMLRDSSSYEVQIIDAVRSVNSALGGRSSVSSAINRSEFNQYEVQLIDAIRAIGRTIRGGISLSGSTSAPGQTNIDLSGYVPITRTINGHPLSSDISLSATTDLGVASWALANSTDSVPFYVAGAAVLRSRVRAPLITINAISHVLTSGSSDKSRIEWDDDNKAWHFLGNLYADGWVSAGGVASSGGGTTGSLYDLAEVEETTSPSQYDVFYFNGTKWTNSPVKTVGGVSIFGSGNIPVSGGGGGSTVSVSQILTSGTAIASISVDGVATTLYAPSGGGGGGSETDPIFSASAAAGITSSDITNWNNKTSNIGTITGITMNGTSMGTSGVVNLGTVITDLSSVTDRLDDIEDWFEVVNVGTQASPEYALHAKNGMAIYSDSWVAAGGVGSSGGGGITVDTALSSTSENPVQNKAIYAAIGDVESLLAAI